MIRLLFAAIALAVLATACSGAGSKGTPTVTGTPTLGAPATAGMIVERTPPPTLAPVPFDGPASHDYKSGDTITDTSGIMLVDASGLSLRVWTMPERFSARPISHDGRWVFWTRITTDGSAIGSQQLLDTQDGTSRPLVLGSEPVQAVGVSESGKYFVGYTDTKVALFETLTLRPLAVMDRPLSSTVDHGEGDFSADETMAAMAFRRGDARDTVVLGVDGRTTGFIGGSWPYRWSNLGHKLATTSTTGTAVHDLDAGTNWYIPVAGFNPRWSHDDRYLAIASAGSDGGARVFSTSPPFTEVLRTVGSFTCLSDYWYADGSMRFGFDEHVTVPAGQVLPGPASVPAAVTLLPVDQKELQVFNHEQLTMQLKIPSEFTWAYPYDDDGVHFAMNDGRVLALVGWGGKGLCDEEMPPPEVQLPPFGQEGGAGGR